WGSAHSGPPFSDWTAALDRTRKNQRPCHFARATIALDANNHVARESQVWPAIFDRLEPLPGRDAAVRRRAWERRIRFLRRENPAGAGRALLQVPQRVRGEGQGGPTPRHPRGSAQGRRI